jgi:hypothetical protein
MNTFNWGERTLFEFRVVGDELRKNSEEFLDDSPYFKGKNLKPLVVVNYL